MTVPPEYSSLSSYRATLGHKVKVSTKFCGNFHITNFHEANHGARPNAEYGSYSAHPVLGSCTDCQSEAPLDIEIVRQDLNCNWDMIEPFVEGKPGGGRGAVKEIFR